MDCMFIDATYKKSKGYEISQILKTFSKHFPDSRSISSNS